MGRRLIVARYRKAVAAVIGAVAEIVALGVFSGIVQTWLVAAVAVATAAGVYTVPNVPSAQPSLSAARPV